MIASKPTVGPYIVLRGQIDADPPDACAKRTTPHGEVLAAH